MPFVLLDVAINMLSSLIERLSQTGNAQNSAINDKILLELNNGLNVLLERKAIMQQPVAVALPEQDHKMGKLARIDAVADSFLDHLETRWGMCAVGSFVVSLLFIGTICSCLFSSDQGYLDNCPQGMDLRWLSGGGKTVFVLVLTWLLWRKAGREVARRKHAAQ